MDEKRLELTKKELNRLWEWEHYITYDKYTQLDRGLQVKLAKKLKGWVKKDEK